MPDALTVAARANHVLVGVLILAGLASPPSALRRTTPSTCGLRPRR